MLWTASTAVETITKTPTVSPVKPPSEMKTLQTEPTEPVLEATSSCSSSPSLTMKKEAMESQMELERELKQLDKLRYPLPSNIYTMIFLSPIFSSSFLFASVIFSAKLCLYGIMSIELYEAGIVYQGTNQRLLQIAQWIMIPVAVAIQEDLIESYALIANIRFDRASVQAFPAATFGKWALAYVCRMVDGLVSLLINYVLLLQAPDVLTLMLNFAALQFLQSLDDMAFSMGKNGYLTVYIEYLANEGSQVTFPRKQNRTMNAVDTLLFLGTTLVLGMGWIWIAAAADSGLPQEPPPQRYSVLEQVGMMME